ncbi:MAG: DM13 domain-containing protein [Actinobacteria bacterium]|nr:DM13 domain-containing protein [Actinomycetota bacterium]
MNRVKDFVKRRPLVSAIAAAIVLGVGAWLVFGFFGFQTLFIDDEVAEANPFVAGPGASGLAVDETTEEMADAMNDAMDDVGKSGDERVGEPMAGSVTTLVEGSFIGRAHPTTGLAKVITDGNLRFLRFEGFETDNGPDLNVYLATGPPDGSPEDFIDLGDLKGNIGDQNYELADDIDLDRYTTVFIWCVRFSVAFGAAPLA